MSSSNIIGMPRSEEDFEEKCIPLFANYVSDPNFKRVAARGKTQEGIDLIGARDRDATQPIGVQCKLRTKGHKLDASMIRSDVERALAITPPLSEIYVVTTADDDLAYDKLAFNLRQEQTNLGREVDIQIWGWGELQRRIRSDPDALRAFDPNYSASTKTLLEQSTNTLELVQGGAEIAAALMSQNSEIKDRVDQLISFQETGAQDRLDQLLDEQLNQIRDLLNSGQPRTAITLLEKLQANPAVSTNRIRARLKGYLGFAHLKSGHETKATELFLEAFELDPDDQKAIANRILALILQQQYKKAIDLARNTLSADSSNDRAAAFAYQAAALFPKKCDPDSFVPQNLRTDENVAFHRINYLRSKSGDWRSAARDSFDANPESRLLGRLTAEALLEEAFLSGCAGRSLSEAERTDMLGRAASLLRPYWDEVRHYENASEEAWLAVGLNLATACRALHEWEDLKRVTSELLAVNSRHPDVLVAAAHLDLIEGNPERAVERLSDSAESPHRTMVLVLAYAELEKWSDLLSFATGDRLRGLNAPEREMADANVLRARLELSDVNETTKIIDRSAKKGLSSVPSSVVVADFAQRLKNPHVEAILDQTEKMLDGGDFRDRLLFAELCVRSGQFERVIRALDGNIDVAEQSDPLAWLALAFANAPTRPRTHAFFASLPKEIIQRSRFARLAAAAENTRGDLKEAERHARQAIADDPTDLRAHLMLQVILERSNHRQQAVRAIKAIDETKVVGTDLDRMHLAIVLRRHGEVERALKIGFDVASKSRNDERIVSRYPGLIFLNEDLPIDVLQNTQIKPEFWFSLDGSNVPSITGIITSESIPGADNYSPDHAFAKALIGKSVGDSVVLKAGFGPDRNYTVKEIKHQYIWLLHDITRSHATRFPDSNSIAELTLKDNEIQPVLDVAKKSSDQQGVILDAYNGNALPLEALASIFNRSVLEIAELVGLLGAGVHTCIGTEEERASAISGCKKLAGNGVVLDTVTAWTAIHLDLLPALKLHFGNVAIAQSAIDEILKLREKEELNAGREYMTIGFEGEQAIRQIHSPDETEQRIQTFNRAIESLRKYCDVLPVEGSSDLLLAQFLDEQSMQGMLDPILLAAQHEYLLLSEDLHIRQLGAQAGVRHSAWLQAFAMLLRDEKALDHDEYARITSRLASRKHGHVALDADTLARILQFSEFPDAYFDAAAEFIGGEKADMLSHVVVVADFMNEIWATPIASWRKGRAAGKLIERLLKGPEDWKRALGTLIAAIPRRQQSITSRADLGLEYLRDWVRGHFLESALKTAPKRRKDRRKP